MADPPPRGPQDMIDKPKRKWFQFHLSTAIAMMLLVGMIFLLNFQTRWLSDNERPLSEANREFHIRRGWPLTVDRHRALIVYEETVDENRYQTEYRRRYWDGLSKSSDNVIQYRELSGVGIASVF